MGCSLLPVALLTLPQMSSKVTIGSDIRQARRAVEQLRREAGIDRMKVRTRVRRVRLSERGKWTAQPRSG